LPIKEYLLATENFIVNQKLSTQDVAELRTMIQNELNNIKKTQQYRPPKTNLTPTEWAAIKSLKSDSSIIIIPPDKGNKTVILNKQAYLDKLEDRIKDQTKLAQDPTKKKEKTINTALDIIFHAKEITT
jgi:hypothetical protein